jgi:hypothetical protein
MKKLTSRSFPHLRLDAWIAHAVPFAEPSVALHTYKGPGAADFRKWSGEFSKKVQSEQPRHLQVLQPEKLTRSGLLVCHQTLYAPRNGLPCGNITVRVISRGLSVRQICISELKPPNTTVRLTENIFDRRSK